jgi:hypothetical protein
MDCSSLVAHVNMPIIDQGPRDHSSNIKNDRKTSERDATKRKEKNDCQ